MLRAGIAAAVSVCAGVAGSPAALGVTGAPGASRHVSVSGSPTPAFVPPSSCQNGTPGYNFPGSGDAADPDVVYSGGSYFAFTTGNALGNHLQALVSAGPSSGYAPYSGQCFASSALANPPSWETTNTQTSPGVAQIGGQWLMYYDAAHNPFASDFGHDCVSVASGSSTLSPTDPTFTDQSGGGLICQSAGSIDPSPFVDASGTPYLLWKQNDGGSAAAAIIWSQQLSADGLSLVGTPHELLYNDTVDYPWEATVENPDMVEAGGTYYLLFSAGVYTTSGYSEGIATCSGPLGPCGAQTQILTTYGSALGPGGGSLFSDASGNWWLDYAAWQGGSPGCTTYDCGASRHLFVTPISLSSSPPPPPACTAPASTAGYWFVASDGGVFAFGSAPFCGSTGAIALAKPIVGMASTPSGKGYWLVASDGGIFAFGDAVFYGSTGNVALSAPIAALASSPSGKGYWIVGADGATYAFGDAKNFGSPSVSPTFNPIVSMAVTPDGGGYWQVDSFGNVYPFGDGVSYGSLTGSTLSHPIVGMAVTATGKGYWLVGSDGGIFSFGDAAFLGSTGAIALARPIVGMSALP